MLSTDGSLWGWGDGGFGQLGGGVGGFETNPVRAGTLTSVVDVESSAFHTIAVDASGQVWGMGSNGFDAVGVGDPSNTYFTPQAVLSGAGASIAAGGPYLDDFRKNHSLSVMADGTGQSWGANNLGQLGRGTTNVNPNPPDPILSVTGAVVAGAGSGFAAVLDNSQQVLAFGGNALGQIGSGSIGGTSPTPQVVLNSAGTYDLSVGMNFSLALRPDGSVRAWGDNGSGQLGTGAAGPPQPVAVASSALPPVALPNTCLPPGGGPGAHGHVAAGGPQASPQRPPARAVVSLPRRSGARR